MSFLLTALARGQASPGPPPEAPMLEGLGYLEDLRPEMECAPGEASPWLICGLGSFWRDRYTWQIVGLRRLKWRVVRISEGPNGGYYADRYPPSAHEIHAWRAALDAAAGPRPENLASPRAVATCSGKELWELEPGRTWLLQVNRRYEVVRYDPVTSVFRTRLGEAAWTRPVAEAVSGDCSAKVWDMPLAPKPPRAAE